MITSSSLILRKIAMHLNSQLIIWSAVRLRSLKTKWNESTTERCKSLRIEILYKVVEVVALEVLPKKQMKVGNLLRASNRLIIQIASGWVRASFWPINSSPMTKERWTTSISYSQLGNLWQASKSWISPLPRKIKLSKTIIMLNMTCIKKAPTKYNSHHSNMIYRSIARESLCLKPSAWGVKVNLL